MKMYFKGGKGIENPIDSNGTKIKEGDTLTYTWFDREDPIKHVRDNFINRKHQTDKQILEYINKPTFIVKRNEQGFLFGDGLEDKGLYLHDFRFKATIKIANYQAIICTGDREFKYLSSLFKAKNPVHINPKDELIISYKKLRGIKLDLIHESSLNSTLKGKQLDNLLEVRDLTQDRLI